MRSRLRPVNGSQLRSGADQQGLRSDGTGRGQGRQDQAVLRGTGRDQSDLHRRGSGEERAVRRNRRAAVVRRHVPQRAAFLRERAALRTPRFRRGQGCRVRLADKGGRPGDAELTRQGNLRKNGAHGHDGLCRDPIDAQEPEGRSAGPYRPSLHEPHVTSFDEINIGDTLGPLELFVSKDQCRPDAKAMGMGDGPGRFPDDEAAKKEGLPGIILPGNMSLGLLSKLVTDWIGTSNAWLKQMSTTYRVPVQPDHAITIHGFITNKNPEERTVEVDVWMENEEAERLVTGTATVEFRK